MYKIIQATCRHGHLIPDEKISGDLEGKKVKLLVLSEEIDLDAKKAAFLKFVAEQSFPLPSDYRFNQAEIYDE
ncbi:MAG: hypothetical protein Fur0025_24170 [Oscillatoriaceae cyanobacterium]